MPRAAHKSARPKAPAPTVPRPEGAWARLTQAAFLLSLILVAARMTMQEILRNVALPVPGAPPTPSLPGPATSIGLDLLCCVPALLVLSRRLVDRSFALRLGCSHLAMLLLAGWTLLSVLWSGDKFAALVNAMHCAAALSLLWSTSQLVGSWLRLRAVAALAFGLLVVLLVQGYYFRFVDLPDLQQNWKEHRAELLHQQGTATNTTEAAQIGKNVENGVPTGFNVSRNTYAAVLVLLMIVSAGLALQKRRDADGWAWVAPILAGIALGLWMLYLYVQSKTAFATPLIAAAVLAWMWRGKSRGTTELGTRRRRYWIGVAFF
ncbi:MAG TPA: hypothetical protein VLJ39_19010, partial [Tepidisphaeraceae bacterium]|nr:hypothetical protein [Tepidisphaeraceae bacterium]